MIKSLLIENWQSHAHTELEFCEGVNVIVGVPNSGKTAILRALLWLIENRPSGASQYMPSWLNTGVSKVSVTLPNDLSVSLMKSLKTNKKGDRVVDDSAYSLGDLEFSGVGTSVPDKIVEALNFDGLNVQRQLDSSFILSSSGGEIARIINRITHLEKVDEWISILTTKINRCKSNRDFLDEQIRDLEAELEGYENLEELEDILEESKGVLEERNRVVQRWRKLDLLEQDLSSKNNAIGMLQLKLHAGKYVTRARMLFDKNRDLSAGINTINDLVMLNDEINDVRVRLSSLVVITDSLRSLLTSLDRLSTDRLSSLVKSLSSVQLSISRKSIEYEKSKKGYVKELKRLGVCPVCKTPIDDDIMKHVEASL
jgi:DNA repair protein SbcC/Rad50